MVDRIGEMKTMSKDRQTEGHIWTNHYLKYAKDLDAEHFTTDLGIKIRRLIFPLMHVIIKKANGKKCILVSYPELEDKENYIFAAGHSFPGDIGSNLSVIDRSTYTLVGTTDQVNHNPQMNFLWVNGLIYVNKLNSASRKESFKKMVRILKSGTSVMLFPEGVLNNTENLNCVTLYPGVYHLAVETRKKIVPIVSNYNLEDNTVLIAAGNPIICDGKGKTEVKQELRDTLASLRFDLSRMTKEQTERLKNVFSPDEFFSINPVLNIELKRNTLTGDIHQLHLEYRKTIYNEVKWTNGDCWEEEIMSYKESDSFDDVYSFIDKVDFGKLKPESFIIIKDILEEKSLREKYDVKAYMKKNWNK